MPNRIMVKIKAKTNGSLKGEEVIANPACREKPVCRWLARQAFLWKKGRVPA